MRLRTRLLVCFFTLAPAAVSAQSSDSSDQARVELSPYIGVAFDSPAGSRLGVIPDRHHLFLGLHASVNIVRNGRWTLGYAPEVVPLLVVSGNPKYRQVQYPWGTDIELAGTGPVTGFAVSPIGIETQIRIRPHWRVYGAGAAGVVWFTRDVPVPLSRAFNYTFEYGAGVLWRYSERTSLRAGYKFHHLSNAYTGFVNPGLDGNVFLVGVTRALGSRRGHRSSACVESAR